MAGYTLAVGTHDPVEVVAGSDREAYAAAAAMVRDRFGRDLRDHPTEVATLLGPAGPLTRPSERLDEFVRRVGGTDEAGAVQPGQSITPDCNGD